jgi:hypothetical protein
MKKYLLILYISVFALSANGQIRTPDEFLGYSLGSKFTPHHQVLAYFKSISNASKSVKLQSYGRTYEGRELTLAFVSDPSNIENLEQIRTDNLLLSGGEKNVKAQKQPAIIWFSYNVHGNEASSTETAMKVLYTLASGKDDVKNWLKNTVVIIDPCLNPDGRDRYVNFFNSVVGVAPNPDPSSREHQEPWPGGRSNHYYFDLNRDWAWQTQMESEQRIIAYRKWLPQVHVDFHEQSYNEPYYFAPAAEPIHQSVTDWQRAFQVLVGQNNAKYFDENGWQYFTKERFDLLYPSYGDTYPLYNGAIGMTYEQGGIRAGLAVITADRDTLTLNDRIAHHFTTSMATLETCSKHAEQLLSEYKKFFDQSLTPKVSYKSYVVKAANVSRLRKLADLLTKNGIAYAFGGDKSLSGLSFDTQKQESFRLERNDMVINIAQKHGVLAHVLFEPQTFVADSNTYDITAWALPYAYGLPAYALKEPLNGAFSFIDDGKKVVNVLEKPYAWVLPWGSTQDAKFLSILHQKEIKVRVAEEDFTIGGLNYKAGSLLVYRAENEKKFSGFIPMMNELVKVNNIYSAPIASGFVEKGKDFGSNVYRLLAKPKVGVLAGNEVSSLAMGEVWSFFEQELQMPISIYNITAVSSLDINKINTLIIPDGSYQDRLADQILPWLSAGGRLILLEEAITAFVGKKQFGIKIKEETKSSGDKLNEMTYSKDEGFSNNIPGGIFKVYLDPKSSLSYGIGRHYYTLKTDANIYQPLENGVTLGYLKPDSYVSGVVGSNIKRKLANGTLYSRQNIGKGEVFYISSNPLFRNFWEVGKQLILNLSFL